MLNPTLKPHPIPCQCEPIGARTIPTYGPCDANGGPVQNGWHCQTCGVDWPLWAPGVKA